MGSLLTFPREVAVLLEAGGAQTGSGRQPLACRSTSQASLPPFLGRESWYLEECHLHGDFSRALSGIRALEFDFLTLKSPFAYKSQKLSSLPSVKKEKFIVHMKNKFRERSSFR